MPDPDPNGPSRPGPSRPGPGGRGATDLDALAGQIVRYLAADLPADGVAALGEALRSDPAARDLFVRLCLLESHLVEKYAPGGRELMADLVLDEVADPAAAGADSRTEAVAMPA
ncbi:MAG: hypothetical protein JWO31_3659, partial [Phycisphaerales bacterium]|nr:hypothetical protein [Phycisphaerales bacterium]